MQPIISAVLQLDTAPLLASKRQIVFAVISTQYQAASCAIQMGLSPTPQRMFVCGVETRMMSGVSTFGILEIVNHFVLWYQGFHYSPSDQIGECTDRKHDRVASLQLALATVVIKQPATEFCDQNAA